MTASIAFSLLLASGAAHGAEEMWVELGPASDGSAGFITLARYANSSGTACPAISIDGKLFPMAMRAPTGNFSALICQRVIPQGSKTASIHGEMLPLPRWRKNNFPNVVVVGDTGCRIKLGSDDPYVVATPRWNIQNCSSPADWPFQEVATRAAAQKPDLVIHVGDYLYREKDCSGVKGCPGGPFGDNLATWEADFFTPARKLLRAAPWVFVRGNHETCDRAGNGWFSLLDPRDMHGCEPFTEPYLVKAGRLPLAVLDDSTASDAHCEASDPKCAVRFEQEVRTYTAQFRTISEWNVRRAWMLAHRPVWSLRKDGDGLQVLNAVLESAWAQHRPRGVDLLLAGHTHVFEVIGFTPNSGHAMQLVVGNSGTKLAPAIQYDANSPEVQNARIREFRDIQDFGWTSLRPAGELWRAEAYDRAGVVRVRCMLPSKEERCAQ